MLKYNLQCVYIKYIKYIAYIHKTVIHQTKKLSQSIKFWEKKKKPRNMAVIITNYLSLTLPIFIHWSLRNSTLFYLKCY